MIHEWQRLQPLRQDNFNDYRFAGCKGRMIRLKRNGVRRTVAKMNRMHKNIYLLLIVWALSTDYLLAQTFSLQSPDGRYRVELRAGTSLARPLQYNLWAGAAQIAANGNITLLLPDESIRLRKNTRQRKRSSWINRFGEKRVVPELYNQYCLEFDSPSDSNLKLTVLARLYNEGFAFQYIVKRAGELVLEDERSAQRSY